MYGLGDQEGERQMITINLLPVRAARKKENVRRQVSVFFLCAVFTVSVMAYMAISMSQKISTLKSNIETTRTELKKYEEIANRVKHIKEELKKLEEKMDIIVKLEANRTGPVRFMDALTNFVIPDKLWLTSLTEDLGNMKLEGMATDNQTVADFMTAMEQSPFFEAVDLVSSKQVDAKPESKKLKKFTITCKVSAQTTEQKQTTS